MNTVIKSNKLLYTTALAGLVIIFNTCFCYAQGTVTVHKCNDFTVTGTGSSTEWNKAEWLTLIRQGTASEDYSTKVKVLYSGTGIYFLYVCGDKKITSTMKADNLNLWEEDVVEAFLWTSEDFPVYFEYEISPMNFELPIMVPNYNGSFLGWLPWNYDKKRVIHATSVTGGKMESGGAISSWTAEFFIPYGLLAPLPLVPPVSGTKWRANMYRIDYDNTPVRFMWQPVTRNFHEIKSFGTLIFE